MLLPKKRIGAMAIAFVMLFALFPTTVFADSRANIEFEPFWQNVSRVDVSISFSGTTANLYAGVFGLSGTTRISGTVRLERLEGNTFRSVQSWPVLSTSQNLIFTESVTVTSGNTYRLSISANVTRNGVVEHVSNSAQNTA